MGGSMYVTTELEPGLGVGVHAFQYLSEFWVGVHSLHDFLKELPVYPGVGVVLIAKDKHAFLILRGEGP